MVNEEVLAIGDFVASRSDTAAELDLRNSQGRFGKCAADLVKDGALDQTARRPLRVARTGQTVRDRFQRRVPIFRRYVHARQSEPRPDILWVDLDRSQECLAGFMGLSELQQAIASDVP